MKEQEKYDLNLQIIWLILLMTLYMLLCTTNMQWCNDTSELVATSQHTMQNMTSSNGNAA